MGMGRGWREGDGLAPRLLEEGAEVALRRGRAKHICLN